LTNEVVAESAARFFVNQPITCLFVDVPGGMQHAVSPEHDLPVVCLSGEALTLADQAFSDAKPARLRIDQQKPRLRRRLRFFDKENKADVLTIHLGNPAALTFRIEVLDELSRDLGEQRLELLVPTVPSGVLHSVLLDDPAHIAWLMLSNEVISFALRLLAEQPLDGLHRGAETSGARKTSRARSAGSLNAPASASSPR
jgi:hypothetical protein